MAQIPKYKESILTGGHVIRLTIKSIHFLSLEHLFLREQSVNFKYWGISFKIRS